VLAYSTLYLLWFRTLRGYYGWRLWSSVFGVGLLCLLVASLDEGHQAFLNTRSGRVWDVALDMAGVTMAALVSPFFWKPGCAPVPVASPGAPSL
jgi:VanZ family protein